MNIFNIEFIANIELYFLSLVILFILFINVRKQKTVLLDQKLFYIMIISNFFIILLDSFIFVLNKNHNPSFVILNSIISSLYYMLNPFIPVLWTMYVDFIINRSILRMKKILLISSIPFLINVYFSISSIFTGTMFYIDKSGVYHRGNFFFIVFIISFSYLIYAFSYTIFNKKRIENSNYLTLLIFPLPPIIGALIQFLFYGVVLIWQATTISLLLSFIKLQNLYQSTDYLTGLFNRRQLDYYLYDRLKDSKKEIVLAGIMIDIDNFKKINDTYGHHEGDKILKIIATVLKASVSNGAFISRYAGDEFVILINTVNKADLEKTVTSIEKNIQAINRKNISIEAISISMGYDVYKVEKGSGFDEFLNHIDKLMYKTKAIKKLNS